MTPRAADSEIDWESEARRGQIEALRLLRDDMRAWVEEKHKRQTKADEENKALIKEIRDTCRQEIKDFRNEQMTYYVSEKTLDAKLALIALRIRLPELLIYGFCALILTAVVYTWIRMGGLHS